MQTQSTSFSQFALDTRILALPVGHLQFSESVRLAFRKRETIGGLIAAFESGRPRWSRLVRSEISMVLGLLTRCMQRGTEQGWEQFRTQRPKAADATAIYFTSFSFDRLQSSVRGLVVGTLHLRTRVATALARAKIRSIDDLIYGAIRGILRPHPGGAGTCLEIIEILEALSQAVQASGECDWTRYTKCRGILLLPRRTHYRFVAQDCIDQFDRVIQTAVLAGFGQRGAIFTRDNLLCAKERRQSSETIAKQLSIARQQVESLRKLIVQRLRDALLKDDYSSCCFRFRPEFVAPLRTLAGELSKVRDRAIGYSEWNKILSRCLLTTAGPLARIESGLLEILGFRLVTFKQTRFRPIILPCDRDAAPFRRVLTKAEQLLAIDFAAGVSIDELFSELKRSECGKQLGKGDMRAVIESLPGVCRRRGTDRYECRIHDVRHLGNLLQRVMRDLGQPAHFRDLAFIIQEVRAAPRMKTRATVSALSCNKRFKPIGRSGFWTLAEWSVETRSITDLAHAFLTQHNRSATETDLYKFVSQRRKVARQSMGTLLGKDDRFMRVKPGTWALSRPIPLANHSKEVGGASAPTEVCSRRSCQTDADRMEQGGTQV